MMTTSEDVKRMLDDALSALKGRRLAPEDEALRRRSCEALCEQFVHSCMTLAGGDPEQLKIIFQENEAKAMVVIAMVVEATTLMPEGGVSTRDLWERAMKAVDEN